MTLNFIKNLFSTSAKQQILICHHAFILFLQYIQIGMEIEELIFCNVVWICRTQHIPDQHLEPRRQFSDCLGLQGVP
jgi:hypothetical protein